ncbi:hypothetical protein DFH07DRAFT_937408 [Mycena maculata]|uniref:MYND-type domain-containing protein n=1 Tax=Mycena maculata TaxID=230809 RepID=A0AAD7HGM2_9AGAR|nr:hypothetical protein DFH07DRAFT_859124 [Mycena maculata]KAJ7773747.1 hypothetical protein DFH07DRAFT_937408 [Mycena maculata]
MPKYSAESVTHKITEHSCKLPACSNSKLQGKVMRLCAQCKSVHYCSTDCQRADWPNHKQLCKRLAAARDTEESEGNGDLAEDFAAWQAAMGPLLLTWICTYGLTVYRHPENIRTKFIFLSLKARAERPFTPLKMFEYGSITVLDMSALDGLLGGSAQDIKDHISESDKQVKAKGKAGTALVIVSVKRPGGSGPPFVRVVPVVLRMEELAQDEFMGWENMAKDIINEGRSIKHRVAKLEKSGQLEDAIVRM